jgi:predicted aspartyl protease
MGFWRLCKALVVGLVWLAAGLAPQCAAAEAAASEAPATPAPAPDQPSDADSAPQDITIALDRTARLTLEVTINGQGPFNFLVDTGSDRTVISSELAAQLKLPPGPEVTMHEPAGADQVQTVVIDRLKVGDRLVQHIEAPAVSGANLGEAGIVGVDALKDLHLMVDFATMRISTSPSHEESATSDTIVVYGRNRFGHLILADGSVRGRQVYVVVDTGSDISVGNPALLALLSKGKPITATGEVHLLGVTGKITTYELNLIPDADIGNLRIHNMQLAFADDHIFDYLRLEQDPAIILGMDILRLCRRITLDVRRHQASFTLPGPS